MNALNFAEKHSSAKMEQQMEKLVNETFDDELLNEDNTDRMIETIAQQVQTKKILANTKDKNLESSPVF